MEEKSAAAWERIGRRPQDFPARLDYKAGSIACELLAEHVIGIEMLPGITPILDDGRPFSF